MNHGTVTQCTLLLHHPDFKMGCKMPIFMQFYHAIYKICFYVDRHHHTQVFRGDPWMPVTIVTFCTHQCGDFSSQTKCFLSQFTVCTTKHVNKNQYGDFSSQIKWFLSQFTVHTTKGVNKFVRHTINEQQLLVLD